MKKRSYFLRTVSFAVFLLALAFAVPARAQNVGPMPAASSNSSAAKNATSSQQKAPAAKSHVNSAPAKFTKIVVPVGTHIPLILHNTISTRTARVGDPVYFETSFPVLLNGKIVIPAGSYVSGEVTEAKRPGRIHGRGRLMIRLTTMILPNAYIVKLNAVPGGSAGTGGNETVDREGEIEGDTNKSGDVGTVVSTTATGTGVGAGVGAAAGDIGKGAGIGAGIGAAAGLAEVLFSRGPEAELPRGTTLDAVLDRPIYLDASKIKFTSPGQPSALPGPPNREPRRRRSPF